MPASETLFEVAPFRARLPRHVTAFASGANQHTEMRGFARLKIPVGVSASLLSKKGIQSLIDLNQPVMVDSGAFSEVTFDRSTGAPTVVSAITDREWRRRLSIYLELAQAIGPKALFVAPDRVGDQEETLRRFAIYQHELALIDATGARIIIPLQVGRLSHEGFYREAISVAGVPLIPAMPLKKAVTPPSDLVDFVLSVRPPRLHLLGMGAENRNARKILRLIEHYSPETEITMDSNRLRAVTGKGRRMTILESELRDEPASYLYSEVESHVLRSMGIRLDYTDSIATPSYWATEEQLSRMADSLGFNQQQRNAFLAAPDEMLQSPFDGNDMAMIELPDVSHALDCMWNEFVLEQVRRSVRSAAIVQTFADSAARK